MEINSVEPIHIDEVLAKYPLQDHLLLSGKSVKLGQSTNVLNGYDPLWLAESNPGLFATSEEPLQVQGVPVPAQRGNWSFPLITLHDNADHMLDELFPATINNPGSNTEEAKFTAGALLTGDADRTAALQQLKSLTGIDLSIPGRGYALVRLFRRDSDHDHASAKTGIIMHAHPVHPDAELGVVEAFRQALARLRPCIDKTGVFDPKKVTKDIVNEYLQFFQAYGTHYVSGIEMGDCIFQVFAYDATMYARVKKGFNSTGNKFTDENAANFAYYTTSAVTGAFGYAAETGKVVSFSNDAAFKASITEGEWKEMAWSKADSIFAMFKSGSKVDRTSLDERLQTSVAISYELTTLTVFAETQRREVWSRILAGALVQKYPEGTQPNLKKYFRADSEVLFGKGNYSGFASAIATPNINVYKPQIQPANMSFVAEDTVENLVLSTNLISLDDETPDFSLPGKDVLLSAQSVSAETKSKTATITLPGMQDGKAKMLYCAQFFGIARFRFGKGDDGFTIVDGIRLNTTVAAGATRSTVTAVADIRTAPPANRVPALKQSLQFSYTFLQSGFYSAVAAKNRDIHGFLQRGLEWIAEQIPEDTTDNDLLNIRLMATDLAKTGDTGSRGVYVPLLPSKDFDKQIDSILGLLTNVYRDFLHVQDMVEIRKTQELVINVGKTLNENIIASGKSLVTYIDSTAKYQTSMSAYYDSIAATQEKQYKQALSDIDVLVDKVEAQQKTVNTAIQTYKDRVKTWITMKAIATTFEIIGGVFSAAGGGGGAKDAAKEVTELAKTIEKIKKVVTVLVALGKAYQAGSAAAREIKNANKALEGVDGAGSLMLSQQEWDEMNINLDAIMSGGPDDGSVGDAKNELTAAFKILLLRGKAMLEARSRAGKLAWDLNNSQRLKDITKQQAAALQQVQTQFTDMDPKKLDTAKVDLVGLTSNMDLLQNQMLTMMNKAFALRDQSLQYEYLQPATIIKSFDLFGFQSAMIMQEENTLNAKRERARLQQNDTDKITFRIEGVPVSQLIKGNAFQVAIGLDSREFYEYVNVRVKSVVAAVKTKVTTPSGKFLLNLRCIGDPFFDRDAQRKNVTYYTESREKTYEYDSGTMRPRFTDDGNTWSKDVNPVTPFSTWELSFPDTQLNKDISFGNILVDLTLTFTLSTYIKDAPLQKLARSRMLRTAAFAAGGDSRPSMQDVVKLMGEQGTVTNNWDVVYNMSLGKINDSLAKQFTKYQADPKFSNRIQLEVKSRIKQDWYAIKKFDIRYGYPQLTFLANNPNNVQLVSLIEGSITECMQHKDDPMQCDPPVSVKQETLTAIIPISKVTGIVQPTDPNSKVYTVLLNMSEGTFTAENMDLSDEEKLEFNKQLKAYFSAHPVVFIINSLDLSNISTLEDLRPNQFLFKTLITHNGTQILQLFIQTANRQAMNESQTFLNNLPEPIPASADSSLIISGKTFFGSVLPASVQGGWKMEGSAPSGDRKAWQSRFTSGNVTGRVDTSGLTKYGGDGGEGYSNSWVTKVYMNSNESNDISWTVAGMTVAPTGSGTLKLHFNEQKNVPFVTKTEYTSCGFTCRTSYSTNDYSTSINVTMDAAMPVALSGTGKGQTVSLSLDQQSANIDGRMSGGGPCGCDDMQAQLNNALRAQIPDQLKRVLNVSFNQISVFALQNLLFPADSYITFKSVYAPGDMVIFGEF